jgi:hypothetical protein
MISSLGHSLGVMPGRGAELTGPGFCFNCCMSSPRVLLRKKGRRKEEAWATGLVLHDHISFLAVLGGGSVFFL